MVLLCVLCAAVKVQDDERGVNGHVAGSWTAQGRPVRNAFMSESDGDKAILGLAIEDSGKRKSLNDVMQRIRRENGSNANGSDSSRHRQDTYSPPVVDSNSRSSGSRNGLYGVTDSGSDEGRGQQVVRRGPDTAAAESFAGRGSEETLPTTFTRIFISPSVWLECPTLGLGAAVGLSVAYGVIVMSYVAIAAFAWPQVLPAFLSAYMALQLLRLFVHALIATPNDMTTWVYFVVGWLTLDPEVLMLQCAFRGSDAMLLLARAALGLCLVFVASLGIVLITHRRRFAFRRRVLSSLPYFSWFPIFAPVTVANCDRVFSRQALWSRDNMRELERRVCDIIYGSSLMTGGTRVSRLLTTAATPMAQDDRKSANQAAGASGSADGPAAAWATDAKPTGEAGLSPVMLSEEGYRKAKSVFRGAAVAERKRFVRRRGAYKPSGSLAASAASSRESIADAALLADKGSTFSSDGGTNEKGDGTETGTLDGTAGGDKGAQAVADVAGAMSADGSEEVRFGSKQGSPYHRYFYLMFGHESILLRCVLVSVIFVFPLIISAGRLATCLQTDIYSDLISGCALDIDKCYFQRRLHCSVEEWHFLAFPLVGVLVMVVAVCVAGAFAVKSRALRQWKSYLWNVRRFQGTGVYDADYDQDTACFGPSFRESLVSTGDTWGSAFMGRMTPSTIMLHVTADASLLPVKLLVIMPVSFLAGYASDKEDAAIRVVYLITLCLLLVGAIRTSWASPLYRSALYGRHRAIALLLPLIFVSNIVVVILNFGAVKGHSGDVHDFCCLLRGHGGLVLVHAEYHPRVLARYARRASCERPVA